MDTYSQGQKATVRYKVTTSRTGMATMVAAAAAAAVAEAWCLRVRTVKSCRRSLPWMVGEDEEASNHGATLSSPLQIPQKLTQRHTERVSHSYSSGPGHRSSVDFLLLGRSPLNAEGFTHPRSSIHNTTHTHTQNRITSAANPPSQTYSLLSPLPLTGPISPPRHLHNHVVQRRVYLLQDR